MLNQYNYWNSRMLNHNTKFLVQKRNSFKMEVPKSGNYKFNNKVENGKVYSHLKLTEAAYHALEESIKTGGLRIDGQSGIKFSGNDGELQMPSGSFKFATKLMDNGPSSFELIHQKDSTCLESFGPFSKSLRINGNNDSYEITQQRMANAIAQKNNNSVKEHQPNGYLSRHRPTRPQLYAPPRRENFASNHFSGQSTNVTNNNSRLSPCNTARAPPSKQTMPSRIPRAPKENNNKKNPALLKRNLRERIVQLLAKGPAKRLYVLSKLKSDGVKECDRKRMTSLLSTVSTTRDNMHHLQKGLWSEVQPDWPFYTEEEKNLVQRLKNEHENGVSGRKSVSPNEESSKRSMETDGYSKRMKLNDGSPKVTVKNSNSPVPVNGSNGFGVAKLPSNNKPKNDHRKTPRVPKHVSKPPNVNHNSSNDISSSISPVNQTSPPVGFALDNHSRSNGINGSHNTKLSPSDMSSDDDSLREALQTDWQNYPLGNFPELSDLVERRRYKCEYQRIYDCYASLYKNTEKLCLQFRSDESKLEALPPDSREYREAHAAIIAKYDPHIQEYRTKVATIMSIEKVLQHLKERVYRYDKIPIDPASR